MKPSSVFMVAFFTALASTTPSPARVCTGEGTSCKPYDYPYDGCCQDYICAANLNSDEGTCIRKCGVARARCKIDRDCCDQFVCTKPEGDGGPEKAGECVYTPPEPTCDKLDSRCSWNEDCCSERCGWGKGQHNWDPKTCVEDTCRPRGDTCSINAGGRKCCAGLTCNDEGKNKTDPRCY